MGLTYNEYAKALLYDKMGFFTDRNPFDRYTVTTNQATKYYGQVEVKLAFRVHGIVPIGEHRIWARWAFYNPDSYCIQGVDCLGPETLDGNEEPFFYSQFVNLGDYFHQDDRSWYVTMYWIMTALSVFGIFALPFKIILSLYLHIDIFWKSWGPLVS